MTVATAANVAADSALMFDRGELRSFDLHQGRWSGTRRYWSGRPWQMGSAAYWEQIASEAERPVSYRLGDDLLEELGACLLGGYGISSDMAAAAFERIRANGAFESPTNWSAADLEALLSEPFSDFARPRRYRFPRQRAARLHAALSAAASGSPPDHPVALRDWLLRLPGVGPKTASWIVRNQTSSDAVAIIDIHIIRAGNAAGIFDARWQANRDYALFEHAFLSWAGHAGLPASLLDACVWGVLAHAGPAARDILGTDQVSKIPAPVWPIDS